MSNSGRRILSVDDEAGIRKFLEIGLGRSGFEVDTAANADEAWQRLKQQDYDALLLDVRMPGKSGMELLPDVRVNYPYTPVIMLTAVGDTQTAVSCMKLGALDYLTKPFDLSQVVAALERAILHGALLKERAKLQKLQEDLTHMIIHDIRNELTPISMILELISQNDQLDEKEKKFVHSAMTASRNLANMVQSLLEVAKLEKGEMQLRITEVDGGKLVQEVAESFAAQAEKGSLMLASVCSDPVRVAGDADLLRRVLFNLVHNAIKFTPKGGSITLAVSSTQEGGLFSVQDSGTGIPKEYHEKVFEKFSSACCASRGSGGA